MRPRWRQTQQSECDQFYADCSNDQFCFATARQNHLNNAASFWGIDTSCSAETTGCQRMSEIYESGTQMCMELWDYGTSADPDENVNAFTVVPTAQETATNSFSLLGGVSIDDDLLTVPASQPNTNDQVLIDSNPFPDDHVCSPADPVASTTNDPIAPAPTLANGVDAPAALRLGVWVLVVGVVAVLAN